jgi:DUF4097 and DUF4098 domain-containing protein YvlB
MSSRVTLLLWAMMLMWPSAAKPQALLNRGMKLDADGGVRIYNLAGTVKVNGWNRDSVAVRGNVGKGNVFHMGGDHAGMKMFVENADERNPSAANIEVWVPLRTKLWIKTATAGVSVGGIAGSLDIYVVSGTVTVTGNPADVNAEAIDGPIHIAGSPDWVRAKSASGDVTFNGKSGDVTISTVSGKIGVKGIAFEKAKFESVTGDIQFDGSFERGGLIDFDTHSGAITIGLNANAPADFDIVSIAGTIANTLTRNAPVPGRYGRGAELRASAGGGGTQVVVRSFKGSVTLRSSGVR